jgi:hypothetical protein
MPIPDRTATASRTSFATRTSFMTPMRVGWVIVIVHLQVGRSWRSFCASIEDILCRDFARSLDECHGNEWRGLSCHWPWPQSTDSNALHCAPIRAVGAASCDIASLDLAQGREKS